jgi:hypothetical protein
MLAIVEIDFEYFALLNDLFIFEIGVLADYV